MPSACFDTFPELVLPGQDAADYWGDEHVSAQSQDAQPRKSRPSGRKQTRRVAAASSSASLWDDPEELYNMDIIVATSSRRHLYDRKLAAVFNQFKASYSLENINSFTDYC
eukprot:g63062.t1